MLNYTALCSVRPCGACRIIKIERKPDLHVTSKREKLQYAYVFITDLLTLTVSIVLAWLITDGLLNVIVPYEPRDWMQTISLVFLSFVATFFCFDQDENIVTRSLGREFRLSVKFNILLGPLCC